MLTARVGALAADHIVEEADDGVDDRALVDRLGPHFGVGNRRNLMLVMVQVALVAAQVEAGQLVDGLVGRRVGDEERVDGGRRRWCRRLLLLLLLLVDFTAFTTRLLLQLMLVQNLRMVMIGQLLARASATR